MAATAAPTPAVSASAPFKTNWETFELALPHPHLNRYTALKTTDGRPASYKLVEQRHANTNFNVSELLQHPGLTFLDLTPGEDIPLNNNSAWARARRSPSTSFSWTTSEAPRVGSIWLLIYSIFTVYHEPEHFRLSLNGSGAAALAHELQAVGLAVAHPPKVHPNLVRVADAPAEKELLVLRSTFWQGAGSPFGPRPVWLAEPLPESAREMRQQISQHPILPASYTLTTRFPELPVHIRHPVRPQKPTPGSVFYSRWIPHLKEHFSMVALDYTNAEHLSLFNKWQNDPRVAAGWNETGTLDQHREYLRKLHEDPHVLTVLGRWNETFFSYYEIYWAKEDHLGGTYDPGDYDRGRHSLVGDTRFRGHHRAQTWWACLMHYIFLDEPRTTTLVGEPKASNDIVLGYDFETGMFIERYVDLGHKRSALVKVPREKFFQWCPLGTPTRYKVQSLMGPRL